MDENFKKEIIDRLARLENVVFKSNFGERANIGDAKIFNQKQITLPEIARERKFRNGQEKVAVIVGYLEKIAKLDGIMESKIREEWRGSKFSGSYARTLLNRAIEDGLVRDLKNGAYDLTQSGEGWFDKLLENNK